MAGGGKDFTDFVIMVHGAGERLVHLDHARYKSDELTFDSLVIEEIESLKSKKVKEGSRKLKNLEKEKKYYRFQDDTHYQIYLLNLDRATRIRWAPWKKFNWKHPFWSLNELLRSKKIGLIRYQEYCGSCRNCSDKTGDRCKATPEFIEPIHISRTHQPSGRILDSAKPLDPKQKEPILTSWLSPYGLKMIVDSSPKYKKAYKSYAFGLLKKLGGKWMYLLIAGVVIIVVILYFTGYLSFGGR